MNYIGYLCNVSLNRAPNKTLTKSVLYRAVEMDRQLKKHGVSLFLYSPKYLLADSKQIEGYAISDNSFHKETIDVPSINGNWTPHSKKLLQSGMGYQNFKHWTTGHDIDVCIPYEFSELASNKYKTYRIIQPNFAHLQPYTELFNYQAEQIARFFSNVNLVFIKPNSGNMGNKILVIRKVDTDNSYTINFYLDKTEQQFQCINLTDVIQTIRKCIDGKIYIIQKGIETQKIENSVFDIRSIVLFDGVKHHWLHEIRVGESGKYISNVYQGGYSTNLTDLLSNKLPSTVIHALADKVKTLSIDLSEYLNTLYRNKVIEIAFDFLVDSNFDIFLSEINSKPGIILDDEVDNVFQLQKPEQDIFEKLVIPHIKPISDFFHHSVTQPQKPLVWFDQFTTQKFNSIDCKHLAKIMYQALSDFQFNIINTDSFIRAYSQPCILFVTVFNGTHTAKTIFSSAHSLIDCLHACATKLIALLPTNFQLTAVKVDAVISATVVDISSERYQVEFDRTLNGIAFDDGIKIALLPDQVVANNLITADNILKIQKVKDYVFNQDTFNENALSSQTKSNQTLYTFQTTSAIANQTNVYTLFRGHRAQPQLTAEALIKSACLAGDYLTLHIRKSGRFNYAYLPKQDDYSSKYNLLRHAGSIYSLIELYNVTQKTIYLTHAKLALNYLCTKIKPNQELQYLCLVEDGFTKLGGNALAVLAMTEYVKASNNKDYLPTIVQLINWIKSTQATNGEFTAHKISWPSQQKTTFVSGYYPGEALYAIASAYELSRDESWLSLLSKGANYLINIRDKDKTIHTLDHDHWLLYALERIDAIQHHPDYIQHAIKIVEAIIVSQNDSTHAEDWNGSFYQYPRTAPAATRSEGLLAAYRLLKKHGYDDIANQAIVAAKRAIEFQLHTQFTHEKIMYLKKPPKALGGFHCSLDNYEIRIDYVQHNISALLGLYKAISNI